MKQHESSIAVACILAGAALSVPAGAQPASQEFSGRYECLADTTPCDLGGRSFTVTQSGTELEVKNERGELGRATLTSDASVSAGAPWNMFGIVLPNHVIQWSNGTRWRKL